MPEWGVTGSVYLHQITSYALTAQPSFVRSQATTRTSPRLFSYDHFVIQSTAFLGSFILCLCLYRGQTAGAECSQDQIVCGRDCRNSLHFTLDNRHIAARFPGRANNFTVFQNAQTGSGADPLSYLQDTGGFSPSGKATVT